MKYSILVILLFCSCNVDTEKIKNNDPPKFYTKVTKFNRKLIGTELKTLEKLNAKKKIYDKAALLILSIGECSSCQHKSYEILCKLDYLFYGNIFIVTSKDFSDKFPCEIKKLIDDKELLKKEINLIYTPSIIIVDNNVIVDILPIIITNSEGYNFDLEVEKFIKKTKKQVICQ
jgi:hypothetical protein